MKRENTLIYNTLVITEKITLIWRVFVIFCIQKYGRSRNTLLETRDKNKPFSESIKLEFWNELDLLTKQGIFVLNIDF